MRISGESQSLRKFSKLVVLGPHRAFFDRPAPGKPPAIQHDTFRTQGCEETKFDAKLESSNMLHLCPKACRLGSLVVFYPQAPSARRAVETVHVSGRDLEIMRYSRTRCGTRAATNGNMPRKTPQRTHGLTTLMCWKRSCGGQAPHKHKPRESLEVSRGVFSMTSRLRPSCGPQRLRAARREAGDYAWVGNGRGDYEQAPRPSLCAPRPCRRHWDGRSTSHRCPRCAGQFSGTNPLP